MLGDKFKKPLVWMLSMLEPFSIWHGASPCVGLSLQCRAGTCSRGWGVPWGNAMVLGAPRCCASLALGWVPAVVPGQRGSPGLRPRSPGTEVGAGKAVALSGAAAYRKLLLLFADPMERLVGAGRVYL